MKYIIIKVNNDLNWKIMKTPWMSKWLYDNYRRAILINFMEQKVWPLFRIQYQDIKIMDHKCKDGINIFL